MADKRIADFAEAASLKDNDLFLISDNNETYNTKFSTIKNSILSANSYTTAEKNKLAGIESGANKTIVDSALSATSTNPVQNKAVKTALDKKADKELIEEMFQDFTAPTAEGGFAAGHEALADGGGAIGYGAKTVNGFAGGKGAVANGFRNNNGELVSETGGAVGEGAKAGRGFAGGFNATVAEQEGSNGIQYIDAVQLGAGHNDKPRTAKIYDYELFDEAGRIPSDRMRNANGGFNAGMYSSSTFGGAVGSGAVAGKGFAGGFEAKTVNDEGQPIDAVQLGAGTNTVPKTAQIYDYQLMDANGKIPLDRLPDSVKNGTGVTVDSSLSDTSENPVQNKVIKSEFGNYPKLDSNGKIARTALPVSILGYNTETEEVEAVPDEETVEIPNYGLTVKLAMEQGHAQAQGYAVPRRLYNQGTNKILICDETPDILKNSYARYADVELTEIGSKKYLTKIGNWCISGSGLSLLAKGSFNSSGGFYDITAVDLSRYSLIFIEVESDTIITCPLITESVHILHGAQYCVNENNGTLTVGYLLVKLELNSDSIVVYTAKKYSMDGSVLGDVNITAVYGI